MSLYADDIFCQQALSLMLMPIRMTFIRERVSSSDDYVEFWYCLSTPRDAHHFALILSHGPYQHRYVPEAASLGAILKNDIQLFQRQATSVPFLYAEPLASPSLPSDAHAIRICHFTIAIVEPPGAMLSFSFFCCHFEWIDRGCWSFPATGSIRQTTRPLCYVPSNDSISWKPPLPRLPWRVPCHLTKRLLPYPSFFISRITKNRIYETYLSEENTHN